MILAALSSVTGEIPPCPRRQRRGAQGRATKARQGRSYARVVERRGEPANRRTYNRKLEGIRH